DAHHSANSWAVGAQWACRQSELDIRDKCKIEDASRDKSARFSGSHSTNAITDFEFRPPAFGKRDNLPNWAPEYERNPGRIVVTGAGILKCANLWECANLW
ncbi:hypothetical protein FA15DRAFT_661612, partial [Coprinopsis marcescibilis]